MLSRAGRLTSSTEFAEAIRRGRRAGTRRLVLHLHVRAGERPARGPRIGFVVSKAVGNAVTRNQVKRRLRHLARERLTSLPGSCVLVVRALPPASTATFGELADDFDAAMGRLLRRASTS